MQDVWEFSREANKYVSAFVAVGVMWRLIPQVLDPERWRSVRALHLMLWFAFIALASINASIATVLTNGTPNWTSLTRLLLSLFAIGLCFWWPHPRKFIPVEMVPYGSHDSRR